MAKSIAVDNNTMAHAGVRAAMLKVQSALVDVCLSWPGLMIGTTANTKVKIINTTYAMVDNILVAKAPAEITLSGTVTNAKFNVFVLTMTSGGTVTATMGTEGATLAAVVFPTIPADSCVLGFVIVNPTGTGNFVGGTTALDDATVVPNAVFINTPRPFGSNAVSL